MIHHIVHAYVIPHSVHVMVCALTGCAVEYFMGHGIRSAGIVRRIFIGQQVTIAVNGGFVHCSHPVFIPRDRIFITGEIECWRLDARQVLLTPHPVRHAPRRDRKACPDARIQFGSESGVARRVLG